MRSPSKHVFRWLSLVALAVLAVAPTQAATSDESLLTRLGDLERSIEVATVLARTALLAPGTDGLRPIAEQLASLLDGEEGILEQTDRLLEDIVSLHVSSTTRLELTSAMETAIMFLDDAQRDLNAILASGSADARGLMRSAYGSVLAALGLEDSSFTLAALRSVFATLPDAEILVTPSDSIQAAIDRVLPGGIVRLQPGTYEISGPIEISKDVTLLGPAVDEGVARIAYPYAHGHLPVLDITSMNAVKSIDIRIADISLAYGHHGVEIMGLSTAPITVTFQRVEVENCARFGFSISVAHVRLESCISRNNDRNGLRASLASVVEIYDSTFTGNGAQAESELPYIIVAGLHVSDEAAVTLDRCAVTSNRGPGAVVENSASLVVRDCDFMDNQGDGIFLWDHARLTLRGSRILRNAGMGVRAYLPGCAIDPTAFTAHFFDGTISGSGNLIPGPGATDGNQEGSVCPEEYHGLMD